jgi:tetratricopeptide (TPR) repeat protein
VVGYSLLRRSGPSLVRFGVVWFVVLIAPSSFLIVLGFGDAMAEHRVYLASCGLFIAAGSFVAWILAAISNRAAPTRALAYALVVVGLLSLGSRTVLRNFIWNDPVQLWREAVALAPSDPLPRTVLAEELDKTGRYEEAAVEYRTALDLSPTDPGLYLKLAVCLATMEKFDEATAVVERLRSIAPESPVVTLGLGAVAAMSGQTERARALLRQTLAKDPGDILSREWLALVEEQLAGDPAAALERCEEIQRLTPGRLSNQDCIRRNRERLAALDASHR